MLKVNINGVDFKNPVIAASGTFGFGSEYNEFYDVGILGGISSKGLTINPKEGNSGIRVFETPSGMMNSVGLQNPGIDKFMNEELIKMKQFDTNIIANVGGGCIEDYEAAVEKLRGTDIDMIELNISCPNVKSGGMAFGIKSDVAYEVVSKIKAIADKPIMVKLSPNAEDIVDMAIQCEKAGADSVSLINTLKGLAIDPYKRKPVFDNIYAGVSGPAVKPIALRMVHEVSKAVSIPVIGLGGIVSGVDAIEFMMAGASAIQIGTVNFFNPNAGKEVIEQMEQFCKEQGIKDINEIMNIISIAKEYMIAHGNPTQWGADYPGEEVLKSDIMNNNSYVITDNGRIVGTFTFIMGDEPTYQIIKNGEWHYDKVYGPIHRLASNGISKGVARACFEYCQNLIDYIRIDTHKDNISMQKAIENFGFRMCGNIYVEDGSERIAYDKIRGQVS